MLTQYAASEVPVVKKSYTVGAPGTTGVDYTFTSVANTNEQSIQLGATAIIPADSPVTSIMAKCTVALIGGTATTDIGISSGSDEYLSLYPLSSLNAITSVSAQIAASASATSIYFSITPSANWNTLSAGKWLIEIYYNS